MINKRLFFILFFFLAVCSKNDLSHDEIVADPLMNEIPIVSIYNSNNEEMEARSFAICWNYCDEAILSPVNEEELEDETFEVHGQGDIQYAIVTRFLNENEETIGRIQTNFSMQLY